MNIYQELNNNKNILLIFGGFASHPTHFKNFIPKNYDWILVFNYQHLKFEILNNLLPSLQDKTFHLFAFSMGVWAANLFLNSTQCPLKFVSKTAINGTEYGIDETYGIHPKLFTLTQKRFNLESFKNNLFGEHLPKTQNFIFLEESLLKKELQFFLDHRKIIENQFPWDRVIISLKDEVFFTEIQENFWHYKGYQNQISKIQAPHFVFFDWEFYAKI